VCVVKIKLTAIFLLLCVASISHAGRISDFFSDGVFSTQWSQSLDDVRAIYPDGNKKHYSGIVQLEIVDGRDVLGVNRSDKEKITFSFNHKNRLTGVVVTFDTDDLVRLITQLEELFGPYSTRNTSVGFVLEWPLDSGIKVSLLTVATGFGVDLMFTIGKTIQDVNADGRSMGFE
jgi:hypothetical protein